MSEPTLMRMGCNECGYAVIAPHEPLRLVPHALLIKHFVATGHYLIRPLTADDLMQPYFEVGISG